MMRSILRMPVSVYCSIRNAWELVFHRVMPAEYARCYIANLSGPDDEWCLERLRSRLEDLPAEEAVSLSEKEHLDWLASIDEQAMYGLPGFADSLLSAYRAAVSGNQESAVQSVAHRARLFQRRFELSGYLAEAVTGGARNRSFALSVQGSCRMALIWLIISERFLDYTLYNSAIKILNRCKRYLAVYRVGGRPVGTIPARVPSWLNTDSQETAAVFCRALQEKQRIGPVLTARMERDTQNRDSNSISVG